MSAFKQIFTQHIYGRAFAHRFNVYRLAACLLFAPALFSQTGCAVAAGDLGSMAATAAGVPQVNAFLPNKSRVARGPAASIDGVWTISTIAKKIRIEGGRSYAVDGWLHAFTLKVRPDMVVGKNITRTGVGQFVADDLPLLAKATYQLQPDGSLAVVANTLPIPSRFTLTPVSVDDPARFAAEMRRAGFSRVNLPRTPGAYDADDDYGSDYDDDSDYDDYEEDDYNSDDDDDYYADGEDY